MIIAPATAPADAADAERRRLARLRTLAVLDTPPEPAFDALAHAAAAACDAPIALVTFVDERRQWFKAHHGLEELRELPREFAFCEYTLQQAGVTEIPDTSRDPRLAGNPLVTTDLHLLSYAGAPIELPSGERVGTLCVMAREPRTLSAQQKTVLAQLASVAQVLLLQRECLHGRSGLELSQRMAAEAEIQQAREAAESAERAKSEFLDNVSHEIRTPLNGVLGLTRLLLAEQLSPQQRRYVELADASAAALLDLVGDLLDLGRIEAGRMELEPMPFRLDALLRELQHSFQLRAEGKGLRFELDVDPQVPQAVRGDPARLRQVLNNLLTNALKFTEQGQFGLVVRRAGAGRAGDTLLFTVFDTGIGIAFDVQQRLFARFTQGEHATGREYGGTGVGLAIVKQLCEMMGGTVLLQSEPGRGSSFRCELPLPAIPVEQAAPPPAPVLGPQATRHATRVLVAEDNETNQVVVRGLLAQVGYHDVTVVADGQQAVDAVAREHFDLVLMDCRMPVLDGYQAARRLRVQGFTQPILALTANAAPGERERCMAWGMNEYLAKPIDAARLQQALAEWTGNEAGTRAAAPAAAPPDAGTGAEFDRGEALERLGGDEELLAVALASFRENAPRVLDWAQGALADGQAVDLRRHLHSLAGSASMVGALPLQQAARQLEAQAEAGDLAPLREGLTALRQLLERFLDASANW